MNCLLPTGINGLDYILNGGIPKGNHVIVVGDPGTGKTTLGIQYLYNGALKNEAGIYITFEELPSQIYRDMAGFGWDLKKLEEKKLLKVVTISPEILWREMDKPSGLFEEIIQSINCKRIVIDSLSLFRYLADEDFEVRKIIYKFKNILAKHKLTSLILNEQFSHSLFTPFEHFVFDGVIQLDFREKFMEYKERTIEVLKMRGTKIFEGKHTYRFMNDGLNIIPAYSSVHSRKTLGTPVVSTGIPQIDQVLGGGVPKGSIFLIETDSKSMHDLLIASITSQRIKKGEKFLFLLPSATNIQEFYETFLSFDVDLKDNAHMNKGMFIEQFNRPIPNDIKSKVVNVSHLENDDYWAYIKNELAPMLMEDINSNGQWFISYDVNSGIDKRGNQFIKKVFGDLVALEKALGVTVFITCNIDKVDAEIRALLQYNSNGVIQTWYHSKYQYMQVTKSPLGELSQPLIVEATSTRPYFRLL
jgi:circadian clock protein KaiC